MYPIYVYIYKQSNDAPLTPKGFDTQGLAYCEAYNCRGSMRWGDIINHYSRHLVKPSLNFMISVSIQIAAMLGQTRWRREGEFPSDRLHGYTIHRLLSIKALLPEFSIVAYEL